MPAPINYLAQVQPAQASNPLQAFTQGLSKGQAVQQQALSGEQVKAELAKQSQMLSIVDKINQPGATAKDYMSLAMLLPEDQSKAIRESFSILRDEERQAALDDTTRIFSAFKSGQTDLAIKLIKQQAAAERAAGNEDSAIIADDWAALAARDPIGAKSVEDLFGFTIAQMPGGDKAIEGALKFEADRRAAALFPTLVAQKEAELDKATSDAEKAKIEATYAERLKIAELEKTAVDMGFTTAQTNKYIAETKKLDQETAKILAEVKAAGLAGNLTPDKIWEYETKLRGEYTARSTGFKKARQTYEPIAASAADASGAGDMALVFSFMRMLDPDSVVRESEFAKATDTAGLLTKLANAQEKLKNGQFLSPAQRADFARLAGEYMKSAEKRDKETREDLAVVVKNYGLNPDNVFGTSDTTVATPPTPARTGGR